MRMEFLALMITIVSLGSTIAGLGITCFISIRNGRKELQNETKEWRKEHQEELKKMDTNFKFMEQRWAALEEKWVALFEKLHIIDKDVEKFRPKS